VKAEEGVDGLALDIESSDAGECQNHDILLSRRAEVFEEVRFACASFASQEDISIAIF